jgi:3,4-dihydroxy 2-butanone 4-phosphate synthase/GTP cyclohydrolase II
MGLTWSVKTTPQEMVTPIRSLYSEYFSDIEEALADFKAGKFVIITDDEEQENGGDLVIAAELCDAKKINFMLRRTSGYICVPMEEKRLDDLKLPPMTQDTTDRRRTAYTVSVDARENTSSGSSASARAKTAQILADPATQQQDLLRPGHMLPLRAREGGVLVRAGRTEAAVDLCKLAGLNAVSVISEVIDEDGEVAQVPFLAELAREHGIKMISVKALIGYRRKHEKLVEKVAESRLPTAFGEFTAIAYESIIDGTPYIALVKGDVTTLEPVLVRVHSGCLTGDALLSVRCDCGEQLHIAMNRINEEGRGVVLYIGSHEGRGIGIVNKIRAYALQDEGADTEQANHALGFASDAREYGTGAQVLYDIGVREMRLLTNNPNKRVGLEGYGLQIVERVPLRPTVHAENEFYLRTKQDKMGHMGLVDEQIDTQNFSEKAI